jgi:hypothetical protein
VIEDVLYAHPFLAAFGGIALLLVAASAVARLFYGVRERRDRPFKERREAVENLLFAVLEGSPLESFALSTNRDGSEATVTCTGSPQEIREAEGSLRAALRESGIETVLVVSSLNEAVASAAAHAPAHLVVHGAVAADREPEEPDQP